MKYAGWAWSLEYLEYSNKKEGHELSKSHMDHELMLGTGKLKYLGDRILCKTKSKNNRQ